MPSYSLLNADLCDECEGVPFVAASDKLHEVMYFYYRMLDTYHQPYEFRYNVNAFIQALRNVTWLLQSEESKPSGFDYWYERAQERMRSNENLRKFVDLRNLIVKQGMLVGRSRANVGLFRARKLKLAFEMEVDLFEDSKELLRNLVPVLTGPRGFLDEGHMAIGEQIGVERLWVLEELGPKDVTDYCRKAYDSIECIVRQAVGMAGGWLGNHGLPSSADVRVLLETDIDPSLAEKWGWSTSGAE